MADFTKVVHIGTVNLYGARRCSVFAKIKFESGRLSICGVEGPQRNGDAQGGCGQIEMHLRERLDTITPAPEWTPDLVGQFLDVWHKWHLNDMRAECEHQRQRGETWATHPSAKCPDCGYSLGSAWLREEVPASVVAFLESLPVTDVEPAWV